VLDLCSRLPGAVEDYPFGDDVAVFKVGGKMFALVTHAGVPGSVNPQVRPGVASPASSQVCGGSPRLPREQAPLEHR
jgi:predicted DNA-binding protein (MmcQ/YjbR family)